MPREKARNRRSEATSRQSASTPRGAGSAARSGRAKAWATVRTAKTPAAVSAAARKSTSSRTVPISGPASAPVVANTENSANASALRSAASRAT